MNNLEKLSGMVQGVSITKNWYERFDMTLEKYVEKSSEHWNVAPISKQKMNKIIKAGVVYTVTAGFHQAIIHYDLEKAIDEAIKLVRKDIKEEEKEYAGFDFDGVEIRKPRPF